MTAVIFSMAESAPCGRGKSLFGSDGASAEFTIGEGELMAHDVPLGWLRMNMMISYQELVRTFPNEGEKAFLVVLKNCPAVICLQHTRVCSRCRCGIGRKSISFLGIMLGKVLASGQELSGDHHIRGSGIVVNVVRGQPVLPVLSM